MLRQLQIDDFGLIERAVVEFAQGATIFTGETGSGKTMLIGALDFALGSRAGADIVRRGAAKATVALTFEPGDALRDRLAFDGFELDDGELGTVVREMTEAGRSNLRLNGRAATAAYIREVRDGICEIVGQHEAQRLLSSAYHLVLLDRFAGEAALRLRDAVASAYADAERAKSALAELTSDERRARERYDDACFTVREIDEARLEPGEIDRLTERRAYLENVERIALGLRAAHDALEADDRGAGIGLGNASAALGSIAKFDAKLREMLDRVASLHADVIDLVADLSRALESAEYDPAELEAINVRIVTIERLRRKYGGDEQIATAATRAQQFVDEYEGRDRLAASLEAAAAASMRALAESAASLSAVRAKAAAKLSKRVRSELSDVALASGRFEVAIEPTERITAHGAERVEFLFAANAGEPPRALSRVASGGELSRVLLALVVVLADARDAASALVFDEIDAGIGGATATAVGARIGDLARRGQVICVTHLAALATWADRHYVLEKIERKTETTIVTRSIASRTEREAEIARMLSGESHDVALRHARALLGRKSNAAR
ncbi:MAG: DNA repair protein RecN [Candidatus Eremiobacteraeota bacterium]|nr:DNA repair protein RecN [Candidatus Eremiobacteraeota bacterium]